MKAKKGKIRISVLAPFPKLRLGSIIYGESRPNSLDLWKRGIGDNVVYKATGELVPKTKFHDETIAMNLGFNRFVHLQFKFVGSTLFRDFLYSFAEGGGEWAVSSRTIETYPLYKDYCSTISEEFWTEDGDIPEVIQTRLDKYEEEYDIAYAKAKEVEASGGHPLPANDALSHLAPYSISTTFWWGSDLFTLLKILKMMKEKFPLFYNTYGLQMIESLDRVFEKEHGLAGEFTRMIESVECSKEVYYDDLLHRYLVHEDLNETYTTEFVDIGLGLHSHLCRHNYITCKGFMNLLLDKSPDEMRSIDWSSETTIPKVRLVIDNPHRWASIMRTRMCWFSKSDLSTKDSWGPSLNKVLSEDVKGDVEKFNHFLPCGGDPTKCRIQKDMEMRIQGQEPDIPCAILCESRDMAVAKLKKFESEQNRMFLKLFDDNFVKDNPENSHRKTYETVMESRRGRDDEHYQKDNRKYN